MLDIIGWRPGILETSCIPNCRTAIYDVTKTGIHLQDKKVIFNYFAMNLKKKGKIYLFYTFISATPPPFLKDKTA